jgi:hypothetical protein
VARNPNSRQYSEIEPGLDRGHTRRTTSNGSTRTAKSGKLSTSSTNLTLNLLLVPVWSALGAAIATSLSLAVR